MTTALTIRPARPDEISSVLDVWRLAEAIPSITDTPEDLARLLRHDPEALLVALLDDQIVGTAIATWDGWRGGIWRLAVLPEARRRGVARALLGDAEARLRAKGARRMSILVESTDPQALAFWEARADTGYNARPGSASLRQEPRRGASLRVSRVTHAPGLFCYRCSRPFTRWNPQSVTVTSSWSLEPTPTLS